MPHTLRPSKPRVLIVDDHVDIASMFSYGLSKIAMCETAHNGHEALKKYREARDGSDPFFVIVMDIGLPDKTGFEVAEEIRASGDMDVSIILNTAYIEDASATRAEALKNSALISKPNTTGDLEPIVQKFLDSDRHTPFIFEPTLRTEKTEAKKSADISPLIVDAITKRNERKVILWLKMACALLLFVAVLQVISALRGPLIKNSIDNMDRKLDGAVSTRALPAGYRVIVPAGQVGFKPMANGRKRITFEFEEKDAAAAQSLASKRGEPLYLKVTREKSE